MGTSFANCSLLSRLKNSLRKILAWGEHLLLQDLAWKTLDSTLDCKLFWTSQDLALYSLSFQRNKALGEAFSANKPFTLISETCLLEMPGKFSGGELTYPFQFEVKSNVGQPLLETY